MRLLLLEDDNSLAASVSTALQESYEVDCYPTGRAAMTALSEVDYDGLILDLNLPDMDGIEVLQFVRETKDDMPVLVLSARDALSDRVTGLDLGADDYVTKPFDLPELEARLRALLRRTNPVGQPELTLGSLRLDTLARRAFLASEPIELSAREFAILEILVSQAGRVVDKERLLEKVSEREDEIGLNAVEVCIHRLRKKLAGAALELRTIRGLGYIIEAR